MDDNACLFVIMNLDGDYQRPLRDVEYVMDDFCWNVSVISYGTSKTGGQLLKQQWQLEGIEQSKHS
jgi:hypothetical protein